MIINKTFTPLKRLLKNGHFETIYPHFFRKENMPSFKRIEIKTKDNDFLDADIIHNHGSKTVIFCHGLEGYSKRVYMLGGINTLLPLGYNIVAWNYRGCSGRPNKSLISYHAAATYDLDEIVNWSIQHFPKTAIYLVGYSMGGGLVLNYLGESISQSKKITKAVAISAPLDYTAASEKMNANSNWIYSKRFLDKIKVKIKAKRERLIKIIDVEKALQSKTLREIDDYFTAPIHGFSDALDYYKKASVLPLLDNISSPTLLINAINDPFLTKKDFPIKIATNHPYFHLNTPKTGGHVGFTTKDKTIYMDNILQDFFED